MRVRVLLAAVAGFAGAFLGYVAAGDARQQLGPRQRASTTAYSPCDGSTAAMANGHRTRPGVAASNRHPLGTLIRLNHRLRYHDDHWVRIRRGPRKRKLVIQHGPLRWHRYLRLSDRIGHGSELDIWMGRCGDMNRFGRHELTYRVVVR